MTDRTQYRLVGGPRDGMLVATAAQVIDYPGNPDWEGMAYHRTHHWPNGEPDPEWWMNGLPEPPPPEVIFEWHERDWEPPAVRAIRGAVQEALYRKRPWGRAVRDEEPVA